MPKYWGGNYFAHGRFSEVGQKQKTEKILQGLRVAGHKKPKNGRKICVFFGTKIRFTPQNIFICIYLLVMPKYWVKNYFAHGSVPEVGQKQKTEEKEILQGLRVAQAAVTERWP